MGLSVRSPAADLPPLLRHDFGSYAVEVPAEWHPDAARLVTDAARIVAAHVPDLTLIRVAPETDGFGGATVYVAHCYSARSIALGTCTTTVGVTARRIAEYLPGAGKLLAKAAD